MAAIWDIGLKGETAFIRALEYAGKCGDYAPLNRMLRDPDYELNYEDRVFMAQFLEGDFNNGRGRRSLDRLTFVEGIARQTDIQRAAALARADMDELRSHGSNYGQKEACIERRAIEFSVSPDQVAAAYRRSKRARKTD